MEQSKIENLNHRIRALAKLRKQHQTKIDRLLGLTPTKPDLISQQSSRASDISVQVNLLAHLESQEQDQMAMEAEDRLTASLQDRYPAKKLQIAPKTTCVHGWLYCENSVDFELVVGYLQKNHLWEHVFELDEFGYFANLASTYQGVRRVNLSKQGLLPEEESLVIEWKGQNGEDCISLGLLLLYRTLSSLRTGSAPKIFQLLFGFPYVTYNLKETTEYLEFSRRKREIVGVAEGNWLLLGLNRVNSRLFELPINQITSPQNLVHSVSQIAVIDQRLQNHKSINLIHKRNHFVVVDLDVEISGEYTLTFSSQPENTSKFRVCLVDEDSNIIEYTRQYLPNMESIRMELEGDCEYKLYVSGMTVQKESSFSLTIQSLLPLENMRITLKFKEEYNWYTKILADCYLQVEHISQVEKEMLQLSQIYPQAQVLVVRAALSFMGLFVDFISLPKAGQFTVQYEGNEVLCDSGFKSSRVKLTSPSASIERVYLSKDRALVSCGPGLAFRSSSISL